MAWPERVFRKAIALNAAYLRRSSSEANCDAATTSRSRGSGSTTREGRPGVVAVASWRVAFVKSAVARAGKSVLGRRA